MKRWLSFLIVFILLGSYSCEDYTPPFDVAYITGYDLRLCPCCGGYFIEVDEVPYRFYNIPAGSNVDLPNETFPLKVLIKWKPSAFQCLGDEIDIETLVKF